MKIFGCKVKNKYGTCRRNMESKNKYYDFEGASENEVRKIPVRQEASPVAFPPPQALYSTHE
jgi:hypothetical protein